MVFNRFNKTFACTLTSLFQMNYFVRAFCSYNLHEALIKKACKK